MAQLTAVSVSWYTWLDQGHDIRISPAALQRIGKVLQLSPVEQEYLDALVFGRKNGLTAEAAIPREVIAMAEALSPHPAFIRRANMDILYWNDTAHHQIYDLVDAARGGAQLPEAARVTGSAFMTGSRRRSTASPPSAPTTPPATTPRSSKRLLRS
ncbi:hypothetical protein [Candidatus Pantoea persica]|uniref:hypothetical protein n=1 Tax=Candidatus Pantoea persica TaxID=2518128 RepID=UPI00215D7B2A|nr:hypothetical protein [Candidatus Pantoea persica]MBA2814035.1 transcriptional regulator [Candidatus Pantoea persica]